MTSKRKLLSVGELLWDVLPEGKRCGGAPANIVYHAALQGLDARICTALGKDADGDELLQKVSAAGVNSEFIARNDLPTGTVTVQLEYGKPAYTIHAPAAWDAIPLSDSVLDFAAGTDAFCFGTLAQRDERSRKTILELAACVPDSALKIFDINLRQNFYSADMIGESLTRANVLKLSDEELPVLRDMMCAAGSSDQQVLSMLLNQFHLRFILYTLGADGSLYFDGVRSLRQDIISAGPTADTVGCGDSFLASFTAAYLQGASPAAALEHAARISGLVAARNGAMPADPEFLQSARLQP